MKIDGLSSGNKVLDSALPNKAVSNTFVVSSLQQMLALDAQTGDVAVLNGKTFKLATDASSVAANWVELPATGIVSSVNGKTGDVIVDTFPSGASFPTNPVLGQIHNLTQAQPPYGVGPYVFTTTWEAFSLGSSSAVPKVSVVASSGALTTSDCGILLIDAATGNITLSLPQASTCIGSKYYFKRLDNSTNSITISCASGNTVEGAASITIDPAQYMWEELVSVGNYWMISDRGVYPRWDDLPVAVLASKTQGSNQPTFQRFMQNGNSQGIFLYSFAQNAEQETYFSFQLPHSYIDGTDLRPHVHWAQPSTATGNITWGIEYSWANIGDIFTTPQIVKGSQAADATLNKHMYYGLPYINGAGKRFSSQFVSRIFRAGNDATDTYNSPAFLLEFGFHILVGSAGTPQEMMR